MAIMLLAVPCPSDLKGRRMESDGGQRQFSKGEKISALFLVAVVGLACLQSCGGDDSGDGNDETASAETSAPLTSEEPGAGLGAHELAVTSARFKEWPFTVSAGILRCRAGAQVTFEAPGGTEYGVNGTAQDAGYPSVMPIWALDPALGNGLRVNISEVLDKGRSLC